MHTTLLQSPQWAQLEFSLAHLGDRRRSKRLVQVASALAECPSGTLPQALPDWAQLKAAYRLFSNKALTYEKILAPHCQRTQQSCTEAGEYLLIEDGSDLDYSAHRACTGLGRIGNDYGRGLCLHTLLVAKISAWDLHHCPEVQVVGIAGQKCWARTEPSYRKRKERWRQRLNRPRESQRWAEALQQMPTRPAQASWIFIADREADDYEVFERCQRKQTHFIIRAQHDRRLVGPEPSLFAAGAQVPCLGGFELEVRTAQIEVRARSVTLQGVWRPGGDRPDLTLNVVEARRIIARYAKRWVIEEYHKALKSGAQVEKSELETAERIQALVAVLAVVAVRLLNTKLLARAQPEQAIDVNAFGPEAVEILTARFGRPKGGWTYGSLLVALARLGGFLARRGDGQPGWITIWRGWQRLMTMVDGVRSLGKKSER